MELAPFSYTKLSQGKGTSLSMVLLVYHFPRADDLAARFLDEQRRQEIAKWGTTGSLRLCLGNPSSSHLSNPIVQNQLHCGCCKFTFNEIHSH